jgi:hypothetical protein
MGESSKKGPKWKILENYFLKISKNQHGNIIYQKKKLLMNFFKNKSYIFKVAITNF